MVSGNCACKPKYEGGKSTYRLFAGARFQVIRVFGYRIGGSSFNRNFWSCLLQGVVLGVEFLSEKATLEQQNDHDAYKDGRVSDVKHRAEEEEIVSPYDR